MTKSRRTRTPSADISAAILDAAADLLEKEGPDALSVRRIATAAGVAPMGVYNHFDSKGGIVEALFVQGFERLAEALDAIADIADPYDALREGGRRYRALALAHPMVYQVMFLRAVRGFEPSDHALEVAAGAFNSLVAAVRRAMAAVRWWGRRTRNQPPGGATPRTDRRPGRMRPRRRSGAPAERSGDGETGQARIGRRPRNPECGSAAR